MHDHIEKKSYGKHHLKTTMITWNTLIRQLRVALLLRSRSTSISIGIYGNTHPPHPHTTSKIDYIPLTVAHLDSHEISTYGILAADTLCFAMLQEAAVQHEMKCQEVYLKKVMTREEALMTAGQSSTSSSSSSKTIPPEPLLAWSLNDKKWEDIMDLVRNEDFGQSHDKSREEQSGNSLYLYLYLYLYIIALIHIRTDTHTHTHTHIYIYI